MDRSSHKLDGIPNDLTTSDIENERAFKVSIENTDDIALLIANQLSILVETIDSINNQLKLLNLKVEEAFETQIKEDDV